MQQFVKSGGNGIEQGFQMLAQILAPNANGMIEADLARGKRDLMTSQGGLYNAQAGDYRARSNSGMYDAQAASSNATAAATRNTDQRAQDVHGNLLGLGGALDGIDLTGQAGREALIGILGGAGIDLNDPSTIAGIQTLLNPNAYGNSPQGAQDLANVFLGTGAVDNYGQTQPGQQVAEGAATARQQGVDETNLSVAELNNITKLEERRLLEEAAGLRQDSVNQTSLANQSGVNQTALDREQIINQRPPAVRNPGAAPMVDEKDVDYFSEQITQILSEKFENTDVPPQLFQNLLTEVSQEYQRTRNAQSALDTVLNGAGLESVHTRNRLLPGNSRDLQRGAPRPTSPNSAVASARPGQTGEINGVKYELQADGTTWKAIK